MKTKAKSWKAVKRSTTFWELDGESVLFVAIDPVHPKVKETATVRLTHFNVYEPLTDVEFYVRVGDPLKPTLHTDFDSKSDWVKASLVEEVVAVDGKEILRSKAREPFVDETPWWGTYEARLSFPSGKRSIEIKIISGVPNVLRSIVLSDWAINIR